MDLAEGGIHYFQTYYQNFLLAAVSIAMIGWMFSMYQQLENDSSESNQKQDFTINSLRKTFSLIAAIGLFSYGKFNVLKF